MPSCARSSGVPTRQRAAGPWGRHEAAHLRARERVRADLHAERPAPALPGQRRALPVREGHPGRPERQRLPGERRAALPRHRVPPRVRDTGVRRRHGPRRLRQGRRAHRGGPPAPGGEAAARGRDLRQHPPLQEQHRLGRQLVRVPRELPRVARRLVPAPRRGPDPVLRDAADLRGRRQGPPDPARLPLLPLAARPAHLPGDLRRHHLVPLHHQHARRAARGRREVPAAPRDRGRLEHVGGRDLPQGRHHRRRARHDRGRLLRPGLQPPVARPGHPGHLPRSRRFARR